MQGVCIGVGKQVFDGRLDMATQSTLLACSSCRFPPIHLVPRRSALPPEPAFLPVVRQPPLPPALLQRYLELLLASHPELGYKEALLSSYPHHQVWLQQGCRIPNRIFPSQPVELFKINVFYRQS